MRAGFALRQARAMDAVDDAPCPNGCGHRVGAHRELRPTWRVENGEPVEVPHPDYAPRHFHCEDDGCSCVLVAS